MVFILWQFHDIIATEWKKNPENIAFIREKPKILSNIAGGEEEWNLIRNENQFTVKCFIHETK